MLELYHSPISTCSQKVRLALAEKDIDYVHRVIDFSTMEQLSEEYLELNPNGVVPTLVHNGRPVVDSSVICEYIDEVWPAPALTPNDVYERAQMRAWMRYFEEVPTTAIRVPSFNTLFAKSLAALSDQSFESMTERMPLRKGFYRQLKGEAGFDDHLYDESIAKLDATLTRVQKTLETTEWISGSQFGIADIVLIPTVVRMADLGLSALWHDKSRVVEWLASVQGRPSFDLAFYEGTRVDVNTFEIGLNVEAGNQHA